MNDPARKAGDRAIAFLRSGSVLLLAALLAKSVVAQTAPVGSPPAAAGPPSVLNAAPLPRTITDAVPKATKATLDGARAELEQQEAALRRAGLTSADLQDLRSRVDPVADRLRGVVTELNPQYDSAKARLDQLGPKPKEGAPAEGADVAKDRVDREATVADLDDAQRLARTLLLQAEQLTSQISDRRRAAFTDALFERSYSLISPDLWVATATSLPRDLAALRQVAQDAARRVEARSTPGALTTLALAMGIAIAFHVARQRLAPRLIHRTRQVTTVGPRRRILSAAGVLLVEALPAAAGSFIMYQVLVGLDLLPLRVHPVLATLLGGVAFVAFARAAVDALFAQDRPAWRIVAVSDAAASRTLSFAVGYAAIVMIGHVLDALGQAISAGLPVSIAVRAVVAAVLTVILAELLRRFATATAGSEAGSEDCLGPSIPTQTEAGTPLRTLGWAVVAAVSGALLAGYVAFASFTMYQVAWIASITVVTRLGIALTDEFLGRTLSQNSRLASAIQANLGLRRRSLEQFGVLGAGIARVVLVILALMLALAPWGVESGDLTSSLRAAFFGFRVGDVTISLSTTVLAIFVFALAITATRVLQSWLETTFLPTTELDAGLRNSIRTAVGYLGFFAAVTIAFAYLGLSLEKVAIVAGALSVGIGFGLQSIVNNFVSGLILLWERPIRVGDLVVVGDGEGYVRRISVRATEIETLDRAMVIVPNSNLISGVVKNRVRTDRTGRATISVSVLRNQDIVRAAEILTEQANRHPDIRPEPAPQVFFKKIGETWLDFDLVCVIDDVAKQARIQSDLNFAVFGALVSDGIVTPLGPGGMNVGGLEPVQQALQHIADAIGSRPPDDPAPARLPG